MPDKVINSAGSADHLGFLPPHPAFEVTSLLAEYVGVRRDLIQIIEFFSLAAGKMAMPINLEVFTEQPAPDLFMANRILDILPAEVTRLDTYKQFNAIEQQGFGSLSVILVRGNHPVLSCQRNASASAAWTSPPFKQIAPKPLQEIASGGLEWNHPPRFAASTEYVGSASSHFTSPDGP